MKASEIIAAARECVGTPFVHQGRIPGIALDCVGLGAVIAEKLNQPLQQTLAYGRLPNNALLESWIERQTFITRVHGEMMPGDVLLLRFLREPQHMAVYTGDTIIHAYQPMGRVVEHALDDKWRKRIVRAYRFKGVTYE